MSPSAYCCSLGPDPPLTVVCGSIRPWRSSSSVKVGRVDLLPLKAAVVFCFFDFPSASFCAFISVASARLLGMDDELISVSGISGGSGVSAEPDLFLFRTLGADIFGSLIELILLSIAILLNVLLCAYLHLEAFARHLEHKLSIFLLRCHEL